MVIEVDSNTPIWPEGSADCSFSSAVKSSRLFSSSVLVVLLGLSRFRILRAGAALEGDNQHMNGIFAG